jgi:translation initiation factor 5B
MIRSPIITVLGHVDHGKTAILDKIRGSTVQEKEAGGITQAIGATIIPIDSIKKFSGDALKKFNLKFTIPGLLVIDTPGHEAFTNLRKRGGSIADLAIVVIDIMQGIQPQTKEAIDILKTFKVPFIIAANKIDMIQSWKPHESTFITNFKKQIPSTQELFENRFYKLLGQLSELGFDSDLYYKVEDYSQKVAIIPTSAKTGEGIAELLAMVTGLTQKFLGTRLDISVTVPAKGTVLEIKDEKGMGTTADVIIYEGSLRKNDTIVIGGLHKVIQTKIRALLEPSPLREIREKRTDFLKVNEVIAATGVKILAPDLDKVVAGAPFRSAASDIELEEAKRQIEAELTSIEIETETPGVIIKTDTLGSLEALGRMLQEKEIPIQRIEVGNINRKDAMEAISVKGKDSTKAFILGFNIQVDEDARKLAEEKDIKIINHPIVYKILEDYEEQITVLKKKADLEKLEGLVWPAKLKIIPGYVFRASKPAVFGVEVLAGTLKPKVGLMTSECTRLGTIKTIESEGKKIEALKVGERAAISTDGFTIGRQANEGDEILVEINEHNFKNLKNKAKEFLTKSQIEVLKDIANIKRKDKPMWGL